MVKIPSKKGRKDFYRYIKKQTPHPDDVRSNAELECFRNLFKAIDHFPMFSSTRKTYGDDVAHFLVVHKLQYERILATKLIPLPETRFVVLCWQRNFFGRKLSSAILQVRIRGIRLFDMVKPVEGLFLKNHEHLRPIVQKQIRPLIDSAISKHIDWNIQNFILENDTNSLYYVDCKPTTLVAKWSIRHNLASIREVFL